MSIPDLLEYWQRLDHNGRKPCPSCSATSYPHYDMPDMSKPYRPVKDRPRVIHMTATREFPTQYRIECSCGTSGQWARSEEEAVYLWNCRPVLEALQCAMAVHADIRSAGGGFMAEHDVPHLVSRLQDYDRQVLKILKEHSVPSKNS